MESRLIQEPQRVHKGIAQFKVFLQGQNPALPSVESSEFLGHPRVVENVLGFLTFLEGPERSELLREEEFNAFVFLVAYLDCFKEKAAQWPVKLRALLGALYEEGSCTEDNYYELIHWGFVLIEKNDQWKLFDKSRKGVFFQWLTPTLFTRYSAYQQEKQDEKAIRYQRYVEDRNRARERQKSGFWGGVSNFLPRAAPWIAAACALACTLPGVYFCLFGLPLTVKILLERKWLAAIKSFFLSLVASAFPFVNTCFAWVTCQSLIGVIKDKLEEKLGKLSPKTDLIVVKELTQEQYKGHKLFRRELKQKNLEQLESKQTPLGYFCKARKVFVEREENWVLYMDKDQLQRYTDYEKLREEAPTSPSYQKNVATLFSGLHRSQLRSRAISDKVFKQYDPVPQPSL